MFLFPVVPWLCSTSGFWFLKLSVDARKKRVEELSTSSVSLLLQQCFHWDVFPFTACSVCAGLEMGLGADQWWLGPQLALGHKLQQLLNSHCPPRSAQPPRRMTGFGTFMERCLKVISEQDPSSTLL